MDWQLAIALLIGFGALIYLCRRIIRPWQSSARITSCGGACACEKQGKAS
jgi:hypothetical protein